MEPYTAGLGRLSNAIGRWAGVGPYYAMFPMEFAFNVVRDNSRPGDAILDPFAGRGSSVYAAVALGRVGYGIEINPVGWLYGHVKLQPAAKINVLRRINEVADAATTIPKSALDSLPEFFRLCYTPRVLRYLLAAREHLRWKTSIVDGTLMALLLVYLHGASEKALSNQTRQGKALSPEHSPRSSKDHAPKPPNLNPSNSPT